MATLLKSAECLLEPPLVYYLAALLLVLLFILFAAARHRARNRPIVPFESEDGRIEISPGTVRGLIEKTVEQMDGIESVRCRMRQGRRIGIDLAIVARAPIRLQVMDAAVKERVRSTLATQLGLEDLESVNIQVKRVLGEVGPAPAAAEPNRESNTLSGVRNGADDGDHDGKARN